MIGWWIGQPFWLIFVDQSNGALAQNFPHLKWQLISDYWVSSSKSWWLGTFHTSRHRCNETSMSTTWITITKSDPSYGKRNKLLCLIDIWHLEDISAELADWRATSAVASAGCLNLKADTYMHSF